MTDELKPRSSPSAGNGPAATVRRIGMIVLRIVCGLAGLSLFPVMKFFAHAMIAQLNAQNSTWFISSTTVSGLFLWLAFRGHVQRDRELIRNAWIWGFLVAVAGALVGYFLVPPIYTAMTGKNLLLGPFVGIFIIGPAGFPAGVLIALIVGLRKHQKG
jgi:uncharacterized membrane protein